MTGDIILAAMCAAFVALPASIVCGRLRTDASQASGEHDSATCADCARLRHPSMAATRDALRTIPKQGGRS
jgi:hypothetical protein